ncbi:ABC transporter permease [Diplocloster hominis]|uniref:ABC transporter permease n=1 Tax=Diplocloster hominis TaxID=3079010 RepID=UPI0031BAC4FE
MKKNGRRNLPLYLMLIPATIVLIVFAYIPLYGIVLAFQDFVPAKGLFGRQEWVGLQNIIYAFSLPDFWLVVRNTVVIAAAKLSLGLVGAVAVAVALTAIPFRRFRKAVQTTVYLPHFISWVVLAGIFTDMLSPSGGVVNQIITWAGGEAVYFLGDKRTFPAVMILTDIWKEIGFSSIVYYAALMGIDPALYEAAQLDGAGFLAKLRYVMLPGIMPIIILMGLLSIGNIFNAGFDQIFNMYSPQIYETGDVLDTLIYRLGLMQRQYGVSAAVSLVKSSITGVIMGTVYYVTYKHMDYRIF